MMAGNVSQPSVAEFTRMFCYPRHQETRTFSTSYFLAGADGMGDTVTDEGCGTNSFQD